MEHNELSGRTLGDPHPQYARRAEFPSGGGGGLAGPPFHIPVLIHVDDWEALDVRGEDNAPVFTVNTNPLTTFGSYPGATVNSAFTVVDPDTTAEIFFVDPYYRVDPNRLYAWLWGEFIIDNGPIHHTHAFFVADVNHEIYSEDAGDIRVIYHDITAARTVTLHAIDLGSHGDLVTVLDGSGLASATRTITLVPTGTDTIGGGASYTINKPFGGLRMRVDNGAAPKNWVVEETFPAPDGSTFGPPFHIPTLVHGDSNVMFQVEKENNTVVLEVDTIDGQISTDADLYDLGNLHCINFEMQVAAVDYAVRADLSEQCVTYSSIRANGAYPTVTLPLITSGNNGKDIYVREKTGILTPTGGRVITIAATSPNTIAGSVVPITLNTPYSGVKLRAVLGPPGNWLIQEHYLIPAQNVESATTYGITAAVGTSGAYALEDHTHGTPELGATSTTACAGDDARLGDARVPLTHAGSHQHSGGDEVATATPAANAIPKANASANLDAWISAFLMPILAGGEPIYSDQDVLYVLGP